MIQLLNKKYFLSVLIVFLLCILAQPVFCEDTITEAKVRIATEKWINQSLDRTFNSWFLYTSSWDWNQGSDIGKNLQIFKFQGQVNKPIYRMWLEFGLKREFQDDWANTGAHETERPMYNDLIMKIKFKIKEEKYIIQRIGYETTGSVNYSQQTIHDLGIFRGLHIESKYKNFEMKNFLGGIPGAWAFEDDDDNLVEFLREFAHGGKLEYKTQDNEMRCIYYVSEIIPKNKTGNPDYDMRDPYQVNSVFWVDADSRVLDWLELRAAYGENRNVRYKTQFTNDSGNLIWPVLEPADETEGYRTNFKDKGVARIAGFTYVPGGGLRSMGFILDFRWRRYDTMYRPRYSQDSRIRVDDDEFDIGEYDDDEGEIRQVKDKPYKVFRSDTEGYDTVISYNIQRVSFKFQHDYWWWISKNTENIWSEEHNKWIYTDKGWDWFWENNNDFTRNCSKLSVGYNLYGVDINPYVDNQIYKGYGSATNYQGKIIVSVPENFKTHFWEYGTGFNYNYYLKKLTFGFNLKFAEAERYGYFKDEKTTIYIDRASYCNQGYNVSYNAERFDMSFGYDRRYNIELGARYVPFDDGRYRDFYFFNAGLGFGNTSPLNIRLSIKIDERSKNLKVWCIKYR